LQTSTILVKVIERERESSSSFCDQKCFRESVPLIQLRLASLDV
jgi:hypothetical protein